MSHGPAAGGDGVKADPNLTPLLDLVLQLVMFFMLCANFVMEQVSEKIVLPVAQMAKPMEKPDSTLLYLNVDSDGKVLVLGRTDMAAMSEVKTFLNSEYTDAKRKAGGGDVKTLVVIRAHKDVNWQKVYDVMALCKQVGYTKMSLRAIVGKGS